MKNLILAAALLMSVKSFAATSAVVNLVARVPLTCSMVVSGTIDPFLLGEAINQRSLNRFQIPLLVNCNGTNMVIEAQPVALTGSGTATGHQIYYQLNTDLGLNQGLGWINTGFTQPSVVANLPTMTGTSGLRVNLLLEGFQDTTNQQAPAGLYSGYVQLQIVPN